MFASEREACDYRSPPLRGRHRGRMRVSHLTKQTRPGKSPGRFLIRVLPQRRGGAVPAGGGGSEA